VDLYLLCSLLIPQLLAQICCLSAFAPYIHAIFLRPLSQCIIIMAYPQNTFLHTTFSDGSFVSRRREVVYSNTLLYQLDVLKTTGRYDAFKLKWHPTYDDKPDVWPVPNHLFWDSDIGKWIEGACYFLQGQNNAIIDSAVKELVDMIRSAQQPDGYLNIHFTVVAPSERFTNLRDLHEL
jgi:DUF1680 family protein